MCASPLSFLRTTPPPPRVALLPDGLFFTRTLPIPAGASAGEAATQIELALETVSPFPLAQLYYGSFWQPGSPHALVFAAYRRRFTSDQAAGWNEAELVLPTFAAVAATAVEPSTTLILSSEDGMTAVHWEAPGVPSRVEFRPVFADATEEDRARAREELIRAVGGSKVVLDAAAPVAEPANSDSELTFVAGELRSRLATNVSATMDVRDKADLAARRQARRRDVLLWRSALGAVVLLLLFGVAELALLGARGWEGVRTRQVAAQRPLVDKIKASQELTTRINELATKRLRPFEMLAIMLGPDLKLKPSAVWFTSVATVQESIYTLRIEGSASNDGQVNVYETALRALPAIEKIEVVRFQTVGETTTFIWLISFKPEALK